jgi:hypothetical protein
MIEPAGCITKPVGIIVEAAGSAIKPAGSTTKAVGFLAKAAALMIKPTGGMTKAVAFMIEPAAFVTKAAALLILYLRLIMPKHTFRSIVLYCKGIDFYAYRLSAGWGVTETPHHYRK